MTFNPNRMFDYTNAKHRKFWGISNLCSKEKRLFARHLRKNPTEAEALLWQYLRKKQIGYPVKRQKIIYGYIVDFYIPKFNLVIELDGSFHDSERQKAYDAKRDAALVKGGFRIKRFKNSEVFCSIEKLLLAIKENLY